MITAELRDPHHPNTPPWFETGPHPTRGEALAAVRSHIADSPSPNDIVVDDGESSLLPVVDPAGAVVAQVVLTDADTQEGL